MGNEFYRPDYLYQYTTIESLALILKTRSIKFNSLAFVDDLEEIKGRDIDIAGKLVFTSCWTDNSEENIALWNMYAEKMKGIRIGLPIYPFEESDNFIEEQAKKDNLVLIKYGTEEIVLPDNICTWKDPKMYNYYQLRKITYTDNENKLFPQLIKRNDLNIISLNNLDLGLYKRKCWEFQQEWRYLVYLGIKRHENDNEKKIRMRINKKRIPSSLFAKIEQKQFEKMIVLLGPGTNEADSILVEALKDKYNPTMKIEESVFTGKIVSK